MLYFLVAKMVTIEMSQRCVCVREWGEREQEREREEKKREVFICTSEVKKIKIKNKVQTSGKFLTLSGKNQRVHAIFL